MYLFAIAIQETYAECQVKPCVSTWAAPDARTKRKHLNI